MTPMTDLDRLLAEAASRPLGGWDFSWLGDRMAVTSALPWDYTELVGQCCRDSPDLLDLGTGGGEWLSGLAYRPPRTVATECWPPNVPVAARRLRPLGVPVIWAPGAPDNVDQSPGERRGTLPFRTGALRLVVNRHESYLPAEIARVLAGDGRFLTQQVGTGHRAQLCRMLGLPAPASRPWDLDTAVAQLRSAGLEITGSGTDHQVVAFTDAGALAWYLRAVPWDVPGFDIGRHRPALAALQERIERDGPLRIELPHFWVEATRPAA